VDDDPEPIDLLNFEPKHVQHPANFRDEDVFSPDLNDLEVEDCCGILRQGQSGLCLFSETELPENVSNLRQPID
jgi:hypothetical protein